MRLRRLLKKEPRKLSRHFKKCRGCMSDAVTGEAGLVMCNYGTSDSNQKFDTCTVFPMLPSVATELSMSTT